MSGVWPSEPDPEIIFISKKIIQIGKAKRTCSRLCKFLTPTWLSSNRLTAVPPLPETALKLDTMS
ncbi:MAG TPA: hypothetical protein DCR87_02240 [Acidobacteria bacterium]|nr:hypothetical protein [Acidobacteriota bacterium]